MNKPDKPLTGPGEGDNKKEPTPQFSGVWICKALWEHPDLNWTERCLAAEIDSLTGEKRPCWPSNEFLVAKMKISPVRLKAILQKLGELGVVHRLGFHRTFVYRVVAPEYSSNPLTSQRWIDLSLSPKSSKKTLSRRRGIENNTPHRSRSRGIENDTARGIENNTQRVLEEDTKERTKKTKTSSPEQLLNDSTAGHSGVGVALRVAGDEAAREKVQPAGISAQPELELSTPRNRVTSEKEPADTQRSSGTSGSRSLVSSAPSEHDSPETVAEKFTEKYDLNDAQIEQYIADKGLGYVMEKAELTDAEPRDNAGRYFMAALRDDFKLAKKTTKTKATAKMERSRTEWHQPSRPALMTREQHASLADLKNQIRAGTPAI